MLRDLLATQEFQNCRRVAHVGWGTDHRARWDILASRGADGAGGAEARSIYGGVLLALRESATARRESPPSASRHRIAPCATYSIAGVVENGRILDPNLA